jgi:SAM-dependent methyltransferase
MRRPDDRINPSRFHSRYYHLTTLRDALESVIDHHLKPLDSDNLVLVDFGCGDKPYLSMFEDVVNQYVGLDLSDNRAADCHIDSGGKAPLPDNIADVVLSTQTIEHVLDPPAYLDECSRLLKPGGLIILSTHGYWKYHPDPTDLWRWTSQGVRKIIEDAGFELIEFKALMGIGAAGLQLLQDGLLRITPVPARPLLSFVFQWLIVFADLITPADFREVDACVYVVVGRMPA